MLEDFKLKVAVAILSSIIFAFIFIILAITSPLEKEETSYAKGNELREGITGAFNK